MNTLEDKITVLDKAEYNGVEFEIISIDKLDGAPTPYIAMNLYFAQKAGINLRQVRMKLNNGSVKTEAGALYYQKGNISCETKLGGVGGVLKKAVVGSVTNESAMKPTYTGSGEIVLEPSFKHYLLVKLDGEGIIIDKSMFYACSESIEIGVASQKNISSAFLGGEGIFQIKLSGHGIVILECDVPKNEIVEYTLCEGEELKVDGNFAILRSDNVSFSVTKSDKSLIASAVNGEGLLNTFKLEKNSKKEGRVWICPTSPIYNKLQSGIPISNKGSNNRQ